MVVNYVLLKLHSIKIINKMYSTLFNQTHHTDYKLAKILNVSITQVIQYKKSKNVNYERLFEFMQKLNIKEFEFDNGKIKIVISN